MRIPTATYRIQFNAQFKFEDARAIVAYLASLGISDLYASPIFKARSGSTHGYDVTDPTQLNPELGTPEDFENLTGELQQRDMGWLQDIVPNHMAYDTSNQYLMDILEHGPDSEYVDYFDVCWNLPFADDKERLLAPLLGNFYGAALENGEIQLQYDASGLTVNYYALKLPLKLESYAKFLTHNLGSLTRSLGRNHPDFIKLLGILYLLKSVPSEAAGKQRRDQVAFIKGLLWELYTSNDSVKEFIDENIQVFNGEPGNSESYNLLDNLLDEQFYRLAFWKVGAEEMNYRRFFTVNELISVKIESLKVFNNTHSLIFQLVEAGKFTGLRIDHIDGLYHPVEYIDRLREKLGDVYITVEKILEAHEALPIDWQVQGTSGYDFLNYVNGIFCCQENKPALDRLYQSFTGLSKSFDDLSREKKHLIIDRNLSGDVDNLAMLLKNISQRYRYGNDFTLNGLKRAVGEVLTLFPIYRTYITADGISDHDRACVESVIRTAKEHMPMLINEMNFIEKLLLLEFEDTLTQAEKDQWLYFVMRLQQYTGPLMAKGVEDTTLYVYNRLLSLNEVGGNPGQFGVSAAEFHAYNQRQRSDWQYTMNTTATHDTKRGEDMRARLNVLSELPDEWAQQVKTWSELTQTYKRDRNGQAMPSRNDEYFFFQTIVGAFPFQESERSHFTDRVKEYLTKAIREAKVHTAWLRPDNEYEEACTAFVESVLSSPESGEFFQQFLPFQQRVAYYGMFNSLSQTLLKLAAPGVPDFYQGTELWELSLVDPDNRRPVDFDQRRSYLETMQAQPDRLALIQELLASKTDGRIKLFLTAQALKARANRRDLFLEGDYQPLEVSGTHSDHIIAFARQYEGQMAVAIAPRFLTRLIQPGADPLGAVWQDTQIHLPTGSSTTWRNVLTDQTLQTSGTVAIANAFQHFPVALLIKDA